MCFGKLCLRLILDSIASERVAAAPSLVVKKRELLRTISLQSVFGEVEHIAEAVVDTLLGGMHIRGVLSCSKVTKMSCCRFDHLMSI